MQKPISVIIACFLVGPSALGNLCWILRELSPHSLPPPTIKVLPIGDEAVPFKGVKETAAILGEINQLTPHFIHPKEVFVELYDRGSGAHFDFERWALHFPLAATNDKRKPIPTLSRAIKVHEYAHLIFA